MVFSTNQNRQLYVVSEIVDTTPESTGQLQMVTTSENEVFFKYYGAGGLERTDLIPIDKITYTKVSNAEDLTYTLKTSTVTLSSDINDGEPVSGQDYVLRIYITNYLALGDDNVAIKYGAVHAYSGMSASDFYVALAISLAKNFSREISPLLAFYLTDGTTLTEVSATDKTSDYTGTYTGVVIKEVEQPWLLGTYHWQSVHFRAQSSSITYEGDEVLWATTDDAEGYITIEDSSDSDDVIPNSKKIADLEYFCHGERGDQYRNLGWPNSIPTTYLVDSSASDGYDVLDLHYFYTGTGVTNQASEKDITFVALPDDAILDSLLTSIEAL